MTEPRLRKASSVKEMENLVDDYVTQGYEILNQGERSALVRKKTWGDSHIMVFFLTVWWTGGLGNLAYALIKHHGAEKVLIKVDESRA
jgi:hypothetical protein